MITINGYLTEAKLESVLKQIYQNVIHSFKIPETRYRCDYLIDNKIVVEFDGDQHYRDVEVIYRDQIKDNLIKQLNLKIIRIPYFIQLNSQTFKFYFDKDVQIEQNYQHGFIDSKIYPSYYCEQGIKRFKEEWELLPINIKQQIKESLLMKQLPTWRILPTSLEYILD